MRTYLVVANQALCGQSLLERVRSASGSDPCRFHIVVPATRQQEGLTWTRGAAIAMASRRLDRALEAFAGAGAVVTGEVGDESPVLAVLDVLRARPVDEIIVCTLPAGPSRWLKQDLIRRLLRRVDLPLSHLVHDGRRRAEERSIEVYRPPSAVVEMVADSLGSDAPT